MKIKEYPKAIEVNDSDAFVIETDEGTKYVEKKNMSLDAVIPSTIPIDKGGTGATTKKQAGINVGAFLNSGALTTNITTGFIKDTWDFWKEQPSGIYYFNSLNMLYGQPSQWGMVYHAVQGNVIMQYWIQGNQICTRQSSTTGNMPNFDSVQYLSWQKIYPVGAIYISTSATSPANIFGGKWEQITGKVLRAGSSAGTGGSDNVTLTTAQIPAHEHTLRGGRTGTLDSSAGYGLSPAAGYKNNVLAFAQGQHLAGYIDPTGSGNSHSNLPAYQNLYVWKRTA